MSGEVLVNIGAGSDAYARPSNVARPALGGRATRIHRRSQRASVSTEANAASIRNAAVAAAASLE